MSSSSFFTLVTAGLACLIPAVTAWTTATGAAPVGNPISAPGLTSIVPAGTPYSITWEPTTNGTVTLLLLKGPSTNAVPQYAIVEKIPNSGSYSWTPSTALVPGTTGYGIELIDDETGQYQYSTQFGISNSAYSSSSSVSTSTASAAPVAYSASSSLTLSASSTASANATTTVAPAKYNATTLITGTGYPVASTGGLPSNSSIVSPTGAMTVPASLATYASASGSGTGSYGTATGSAIAPVQTGGAVTMARSVAGLVVAAGVAVFAF